MSLLDNASLLLTPNAYKASKLYSVIPSNGNGDFTATRATTATRINSSGLVESVALNVPRLDYSLGSCPNILLEPQRTNLALQSSSFDNASWVKVNASVTANTTTSPSGVVDADTLTANGVNQVHEVNQSYTLPSATTYSWSVYLKKNTNDFAQVVCGGAPFSSTVWANFDLNLGVVGSVGSATTASIHSVGDGWYRCIISGAASSTAIATTYVNIVTSATSARRETNTLTTSVFLWGAQFEAGAYATSYIPTTTASVTRNADSVIKTGISSLLGQSEGTIFLQFNNRLLTSYTDEYIFRMTGVTNHNLWLRKETGSNTFTARLIVNNITIWTISSISVPNGNTKIAISYKSGSSSVFMNGSQVGSTNTSTYSGSAFSDFSFNSNGASFPELRLTQAAIFPTRLTNTQMSELTTL